MSNQQLYLTLAVPMLFGLVNIGFFLWILGELRDIRKEIAGLTVKIATLELRVEKLEPPNLARAR